MKRIGLTGGIGSGKSTIARAFRVLGVPVYDSDTRSKWLNEHDEVIIKGLKALLGDDIYTAEGKLDKKRMAQMIFSNSELLKKVNELIHPRVFEDFDLWAKEKERDGHPYVINEAAIMVENGGYRKMDKLIVVSAPEELRIERCMLRDNATREMVVARIRNQMSDTERLKVADFTIVTDDRHYVLDDIMEIDKQLNVQ